MWRKRSTPAPAFRVPSPFSPVDGAHAPLGVPTVEWRVALLQVVEADTHDNYLVCRGYYPESGRFYGVDWTTPGTYEGTLKVAKPYGMRGGASYEVGQILVCGRPLSKLGTNPGKAETSIGHPADLNEETVLLKDDDDNPIEWIELGDGHTARRWGKTDAGISAGSSGTVSLWNGTDGNWGKWDQDSGTNWTDCYAPPLLSSGSIASGKWVLVEVINGRRVITGAEC